MAGFQLKRKRAYHIKPVSIQALVAMVLILGLGVWLTVAQVHLNRAQDQLNQNREQLAERIQGDLNMVLKSYDELDRRNVDVQGDILPALRQHLYTAYALDNILIDSYGQNYSVLSSELYQNIENSLAGFDRLLANGQDIESAQADLSVYMVEVATLMEQRFGADGLLLPKTAIQTSAP